MRLLPPCLALALACQAGEAPPPVHDPHGKLELVDAPVVVDAARWIAGEVAKATADGKQARVYIGASWCEPCRRFHDAAAAGQLDAELPQLRLLVFDADRDEDALHRAGYDWKLIPMFAIPNADGRASGRQIEGSIKGDSAVRQIAPRLHDLH